MALIKTSAQIREYLKVDTSFNYETVLPYLEKAERVYLLPVLGAEQLLQLYDYSEGSGSGSGGSASAYDKLFKLACTALCNLGFYEAWPLLDLRITDAGFVVTSSQNFVPASQYRVEQAKLAVKRLGFNGLDEMLLFLEENADTFEDWKDSAAYTVHKETFFGTAVKFNQYFGIGESRYLFNRLVPFIVEIQEDVIEAILTKPLYDELKDLFAENDVDGDYLTLLKKVQRTVAYCAVHKALPQLVGTFEDFGVRIYETKGGTTANYIDTTKQSDSNFSVLLAHLEQQSRMYTQKLQEYLEANADLFPEYVKKDITAYVVKNEPGAGKKIYGAM
jgi:hypothetical protein